MAKARGKLFLPVDLALRQHRLDEISRDHARIARAIRRKDPAAASAAMGAHVDAVKTMMEAALRR
jgi:DNA-binding FadR family transcriptional regulator